MIKSSYIFSIIVLKGFIGVFVILFAQFNRQQKFFWTTHCFDAFNDFQKSKPIMFGYYSTQAEKMSNIIYTFIGTWKLLQMSS